VSNYLRYNWACLLITCLDVCNVTLETEPGVVVLEEDGRPEDRVVSALKCFPHYAVDEIWENPHASFRYWKIRDYAHAYRSRKVTPSMVCHILLVSTEYSYVFSLFKLNCKMKQFHFEFIGCRAHHLHYRGEWKK